MIEKTIAIVAEREGDEGVQHCSRRPPLEGVAQVCFEKNKTSQRSENRSQQFEKITRILDNQYLLGYQQLSSEPDVTSS